ncbi:MAG: carbohydrate-binding protein, partial [Pseudomonadota bacterium]
MAYIPTPLDLVDPADSVVTCFNKVNTNFGDIQTVINDLTALLSGGFDYTKTELIGGASTALDSIDGAGLTQGNRALVIKGSNPGQVYIYVLDENVGGTENTPDLIAPDTNAGTKRWVLASSPAHFWNISSDPTVNSDETTGVKPGDIWKNGANLWVCNSAVAGTASWIRLLKLGTGGTDACAGNDARLSDARTPLSHGHVEADISDLKSYSLSTHDHDSDYPAIGHDHNTSYAALLHNHDLAYAELNHNHDSDYSELGHTHADASSAVKGLIQLAGNLSGSAAAPTVVGIKESGGTSLALGAINDGQFLKRSGSGVISGDPLQDVVGGRLDLVSATSLGWRFWKNNQIRLFSGSSWELIRVASEPTAANTANDLNGAALAVNKIYDVFAEYSDSTSFNLKFSRWSSFGAGVSSRTAAYSSGTTYNIGDRVTYGGHDYVCIQSGSNKTPSSEATYWDDNGASIDGDFSGLYRHDGVLVSSNSALGKKRRWLGVIYTYSNGGTVNFKDEEIYRYIGNYYNRHQKAVKTYNTNANWTYGTLTWREANGGSGNVRGQMVSATTDAVT